ncbi:GFA family protein [Streptomyces peucetius]|uniref:GFA family protein n=1 Tax=Streptomyces peucetius TaxID=1950 RepID=A0ABY6I1A5_STRPE|nr:GFA family protein [Streptomyces peucetius]UYQ60075.1 GFA family protein [Streptomyces peucetius]
MTSSSPTLGKPPTPTSPLPAEPAHSLSPNTASATGPQAPVRTGHCACGRLFYQVSGVPDDPHLCSCERDTRVSGGPAVLWVGFPKDSLIWTKSGEEPKWWYPYPTLRCGFCPDCASQLVSEAEGSDMVMVNGFSLTDQSGIEPVGHSYRERAAPWMHVALASAPILGPGPNPVLD